MAIQNRITQVGIAKQSAKGALEAAAAVQIGVNSGQVASLDLSEEELPITWASRLLQGFDRMSAYPMSSFETLAMPLSVGMFLQAVMGSDTITGAGPYTHTLKPAISLPYLTAFARKDAEYYKLGDCRVSEVELSWETTGALKLKVSMGGCTYEFLAASYTATTDERPFAGVMKGNGGTFTLNTVAHVIKGGSIKISNNLEPIFGSSSSSPADVFPAMHKVDVSLTIVPENLLEFRRVVTGTTAGTTVQAFPFYGSAVCQWRVDAATHLTFNANRLKSLVSFPDTNAQGGPVELSLEGSIAEPTGSDAYTMVLNNTRATAY